MKQLLTVVSPQLPALRPQRRLTPIAVSREDALELLARGAQPVEVLPWAEYAAAHLPGAVSLPLAELTLESAGRLPTDRPLIVYCSHAESDLSARAAWLLVSLGFGQVFRYTRGKADWLANGLPIEGAQQAAATAGSLARPDVPTCLPRDLIAQVQPILQNDQWDICVVVNDERVVLGRLSRADLAGDPRATAEQVMEPGPATVRANANLRELAAELRRTGAGSVLVTNSAGQLAGALLRVDLEASLVTDALVPGTRAGG
jgi:rhodanese-related sulfurtransferase